MKKLLLLLLLVAICSTTYAQVGIGTPVPNQSAMLDIVSSNKGILIPRVALTSSSDVTTIGGGNVLSMLVFNTVTISDIKPGYYYWYSGKWNSLVTADSLIPALSAATTVSNTLSGANLSTTVNGVTGVVVNLAPALAASTTVSNALSGANLSTTVNGVTGAVVSLAPALAAATTVSNTLSGANLSTTVNGVTGSVVSLAPALAAATTVSNTLSGNNLSTTVNGVAGTAVNLTPFLTSSTSNSLVVNSGVLTSTVNTIASTANILQTVDNGLTAASGNVKLGGPLTSATTLTTTAANTLALSGLQQTATFSTDKIVVADASTGVLKFGLASNVVGSISTKTLDYTVSLADETILVDATSGNVTITLPSAVSSLGKKVNIKKIDSSTNTVIVTAVSGNIDTVPSITGGVFLQAWTIQSDGANWYVISIR